MRLMKNRKGQAEILDGLLLLLVTAISAVALLSIAGNYGQQASQKYDDIYVQKVSQNALLSLYHITHEKKSIMVTASLDLSQGRNALPNARPLIQDILFKYHESIGLHFGFSILNEADDTLISTDPLVTAVEFPTYPKKCSTAALTFPEGSSGLDCDGGMCYRMFQLCVWER